MDFEDIHRPDVINYVKQKYGTVYNIRTFSYLEVKGAIKRAGQVLKIDPQKINDITTKVDNFDDVQGHEELILLAKKFYGRLQGFSSHASAIGVFTEDVLLFTPIERQTKDGESIQVCSYAHHDLESMNCLKLDLLGLRNLGIVHETLDNIPDKIDIYNLPINDSEVYKKYATGDTMGLFQVESKLMTNYAQKMKVSCFDDISSLISLCRPGPLDAGMAESYIEGKNGNIKPPICKEVEPILKSTYQVLVYQEQLMKIVMKTAGYTLKEADMMRKIVGRKELDKIKGATDEYIQRAIGNGISPSAANELGRQIEACGRYIFNASHGLLYSYMSYMTGYMSYHYPIPYTMAVLNSVITKQDKSLPYIEDAKNNKHIDMLPVSVVKSKERWSLDGDGIRMGLHYIKGVGNNLDLSDRSMRGIYLNNAKGVLQSLVKAGAMDCYGDRPILYALIEPYIEYKKKLKSYLAKVNEWKTKGNQSKVEEWENKLRGLEEPTNVEPIKNYNYAKTELEVLGYTDYALPKVLLGTLTNVKEFTSKKGSLCCRTTFKTDYGEFELVVFPKEYSKLKRYLSAGKQYKFMKDNDVLKDIKEVI